uniref:Uncharacterized protein n=1 Tax=Siphoviridae sp. ctbvd11 TaxID=2825567 RepID=A0A8S5QF26_9CAUD|nr:MAG TPA: hypothetical protein [Siphoviridae sp. ctbvd11]
MATKIYNRKTFVFTVNGENIYFYCSTTYTKNGFCHHVYTVGGGKENEHSRVSYYNRTWESFEYETALLHAVEKFPKNLRAPLRLEIQAVAKNEHEKAEAFCAAFRANFAALSTEQRKFVQEHTPEITNKDQAKIVNTAVAMMAAL